MEVVYGHGRVRVPGYECSCGKGRRRRVKLWRMYGGGDELKCADCACRHQRMDPRGIDGYGMILDPSVKVRTTMIGPWTPAFPSEVANGRIEDYWSRTSAPEAAIAWWQALPLQ